MTEVREVVRGWCPVCHEAVECKSVEPEYPDDPMLEETDCFEIIPHNNCEGAGKNPTAFVDEGPFDDPPEEDEEESWPDDGADDWQEN
jgi:hypothetical protein